MSPSADWEAADWDAAVRQVLAAFGLGEPVSVEPLGGTATPKFVARTAEERWVVRVRPREFAARRLVRFDHTALARLAALGLPVPSPQPRPDGTTWFEFHGQMVEVLSWIGGEPFEWNDLAALGNLGAFLARFHEALLDSVPAGKEGFRREDDPVLMGPYVDRLEHSGPDKPQREGLAAIRAELKRIRHELDEKRWPHLPRAVTHGDIHMGNVRFRRSEVSALYDFDYLSPQARVRDLCDALMFFTGIRDHPVDPDNIRSLTAPYRLDQRRARILLAGYQQILPLTAQEWEAIPWILRSQWCQMRLRGSRKVPDDQKIAYVLDQFIEQLDWLEHAAPAWVTAVREAGPPTEAN